MTEHELACLKAMRSVVLVPGSPAKRFLAGLRPSRALTAKQALWLNQLVWRHRRRDIPYLLAVECGERCDWGLKPTKERAR